MTVKFIYKFIPILVFYTDKLSKDTGGMFFGFLCLWIILIRSKYKNDIGLHAHELKHAKQHIRYAGLWIIFYLLCRKFRLRAEVQAYRIQLRYPPATKDPERYIRIYAKFLATGYGSNITTQEAVLELKRRELGN